MKKEKRIALEMEFPFLKGSPDYEDIKISRIDTGFLNSIPADESYSSSAGNSYNRDFLYIVFNKEVEQITLCKALNHSTGYAYDKPEKTDGDTYLSALISAGIQDFDYILHHNDSYCDYSDGMDNNTLTIYKPSKHSDLNTEWQEAIKKASLEVFKEVDV